MSSYSQAKRPIGITTPLGEDVLLLTAIRGHEGISELFRFDLELIAENKKTVAFEKVLGQNVTVRLDLPEEKGKRYFNGIVSRFSQARRDQTFTHFRAELVPRLWLLTRKSQSRIFQHVAVPDILKELLKGLTVKMEISGTYEPRDYCTQYRETDFAFASRLMEEEGIRYYFKHADGSHQMVVTDEATTHPDVPVQPEVIFAEMLHGGTIDETRVTAWEKVQEIRPDVITLWDHCFELPGQHLEAQQPILENVKVGKASHKLKPVPGDPLEVYDFPGGYAQRFDGIAPGGGARPAELQKIFTDKDRTVRLRMELEEMLSLRVEGESYCFHFVPGHAFTLTKHFDADDRYLLTRVEHEGSLEGDYRSGDDLAFAYKNRFRCIPTALPYRPPRVTPRPEIAGTQTATVVAPPGEEIFCDKYGRVKVLFHWDRQGKKDPTASCWIRVAQPWAGKGWGSFFWPRAGHEVVVSFEEGDPDQPVIVGSVYNGENPTPFPLPIRNQLGGIKSASVRGNFNQNFNGVIFCDEKGTERLVLHSERNMTFNTEYDQTFAGGRNRHEGVPGSSLVTVGCLPGGGGGGGGPDDNPDTESRLQALEAADVPSYSVWGAPVTTITGALGLYNYMTYGEYLANVVGLQSANIVGANMTTVVNPTALLRIGGTPPFWMEGVVAGGMGGNLGLTMGSNTSITLGPNVAVKSTADIEYTMHWPSKIICAIIAAALILWMILYATVNTISQRVIEFTVFQTVIAAGVTTLTLVESIYKKAKDEEDYGIWWSYKYDNRKNLKKAMLKDGLVGTLGTLAALVVPIGVAAAVGGTQSLR